MFVYVSGRTSEQLIRRTWFATRLLVVLELELLLLDADWGGRANLHVTPKKIRLDVAGGIPFDYCIWGRKKEDLMVTCLQHFTYSNADVGSRVRSLYFGQIQELAWNYCNCKKGKEGSRERRSTWRRKDLLREDKERKNEPKYQMEGKANNTTRRNTKTANLFPSCLIVC